MKKILVVIDMQNDFLTGSLGNAECAASAEPVRALLAQGGWDAVAFTREGHSFLGWKRLAIGSSTVYADGETVTNLNESFGADGRPGDATLVAQWLSDQSVSVTALRDGRPL